MFLPAHRDQALADVFRDNRLGIGFGHQDCDLNAMPGWRENTWGYHADDGGFFHADGWRLVEKSEWMYDTGDVIGCCIDLGQRKAFYTKNGLDIGKSARLF